LIPVRSSSSLSRRSISAVERTAELWNLERKRLTLLGLGSSWWISGAGLLRLPSMEEVMEGVWGLVEAELVDCSVIRSMLRWIEMPVVVWLELVVVVWDNG